MKGRHWIRILKEAEAEEDLEKGFYQGNKNGREDMAEVKRMKQNNTDTIYFCNEAQKFE